MKSGSTSTVVAAVSTEEFPTVVIGSSLPVVVDFWAAWCGPCRMMAPLLEQLAGEYSGRVTMAKVNVEEEGALAGAFGVRGIPALIFFKAGAPLEMIAGLRSVGELRQWMDGHLGAES